MKKIAVALGAMFLMSGLAFGQSALQKQEKEVQPFRQYKETGLESIQSTAGATTVSERFKEAYMNRKGWMSQAPAGDRTEAGLASAAKLEATMPPFRCGFDYAKELEEKWTAVDRDGDNSTWIYTTAESIYIRPCDGNPASGLVYSRYNKNKETANWLITKAPVRFESGKAYAAFYVGIMEAYPERLKVYYSRDASMTTDLKQIGDIHLKADSLGWRFQVLSFDIEEGGDYYFGFVHCSEADQFYLLLDNIEINAGAFVGTPNLTLGHVILPPSSCGVGSAETVGVEVTNNGTAAINKMKLTYAVDGAAVGEITVSEPLEIGKSTQVEFTQKADFSTEDKVYNVKVTGTVLESAGGNEASMDDNEAGGRVTHFRPADLPFAADLTENDGLVNLGYSTAAWEYWEEDRMLNAVDMEPLVLRCMYLEQNKMYRFSLSYFAGIVIQSGFEDLKVTDNFYIVYGPADKPVKDWMLLKSYVNVYTEDVFRYDEIRFKNPEPNGLYGFAIVPQEGGMFDSYNGTLCLNYLSVEKIEEHDLKLGRIYSSLGVRTPVKHVVNPNFTVEVLNRGLNEESDVKVTVKHGETAVGASKPTTLEVNDTARQTMEGQLSAVEAGRVVTLTFAAEMSATDNYQADNTREWAFTATESLYAFDDVTMEEYEDGIGTEEFAFGPVFTLAETDTLSAVLIGWFDLSEYVSESFPVGLEIWPVDENGKASHCILEHKFDRQIEGGMQTVEIPARLLTAGRYFIGVRQLSKTGIGIGYDGHKEGVLYALSDGELTGLYSFGNVALRAVFGPARSMVGNDIEMLSITEPGSRGTFASNEPIEARYRNNGKDLVEVTFKCFVDGVEAGSKTVSVSAYDEGSVSFEADLSAIGTHAIRVEAVSEGDENPGNNMVQKSVECFEWDPYVMDFEICEDFAISGLAPWKTVDGDGLLTYSLSGYNWPNSGLAQGFIAFNPNTTTPSIDQHISAHGGERFGASFSSPDKAQDNWLISPKLQMPDENAGLSFYVAAFQVESVEETYAERYNVLVSTTDDELTSFQMVGRTNVVTLPDWEPVTVDLSAYNGKEIYIAIQSVSKDQYIFMIDDIRVNRSVGVEVSDLSASVKAYPNPVSDVWTVAAGGMEIRRVEICNMMGALVYRSADRLSSETHRVRVDGFKPGLYVARVYTNAGVQTLKLTVR